jgi:hypothetical protein
MIFSTTWTMSGGCEIPQPIICTKLILAKTHNEEIPNSDTNACNGDLPVRFQEYGRPKPFEGGTNAVGDAKLNVPRYFVLGTPLCTLNEELIGVTNTLPDDVKKRRRDNFKKFNNCDINDGQYSELDSPAVVSGHFDSVFWNYRSDDQEYGLMVSP